MEIKGWQLEPAFIAITQEMESRFEKGIKNDKANWIIEITSIQKTQLL